MKPETIFKIKFRPELEKIKKSYWIKTQMLSLLGVPDMIGCVRGRFVAIELKKDALEGPSPLQRYVLDRIKACGGFSFVAHPGNAHVILEDVRRIR